MSRSLATSTSALSPRSADADTSSRAGVIYGIAAYGFWGVVPVYFKLIAHVDVKEVLAHRAIWCFLFLVLVLGIRRQLRQAVEGLKSRRVRLLLVLSTLLIATNWFAFLWAVTAKQILYASLAYYINPLVSVLLGFLFLHERLRAVQWFAVALATIGVTVMAVYVGSVPLATIAMALSFAFYGLVRKTVGVGAMVGLTVETALLAPLGLVWLALQGSRGNLQFLHDGVATDLLLAASGVVTAIPLLLFAKAARRLRLATLGLLQYIAPTGQFLLAVLVYHETFAKPQVFAFTCVWIAVMIYSYDTYRHGRRVRRQASAN